MGQGSSKNTSQTKATETASKANNTHDKGIKRLRKLLSLRVPGLPRKQSVYRPPARFSTTTDHESQTSFSLPLLSDVCKPSSFNPLQPSAFNWDMAEIETDSDSEFVEDMYDGSDSQARLVFPDPLDRILQSPAAEGDQREKRGYRDDTLFPRYPERSLSARLERNLEVSRKIHANARADSQHYLFSANSIFVENCDEKVDNVRSVLGTLNLNAPVGQSAVQADNKISPPPALQTLTLTKSITPEPHRSPVAIAEQRNHLSTPRRTPLPLDTVKEVSESVAPHQANLHDVVEPTPSPNTFDCHQTLTSIVEPYLDFARKRAASAKKTMRQKWKTISQLLDPTEPFTSSPDERYLNTASLLQILRQTYPMNIVLYLKRLAIQSNLNDLARHYLDPEKLLSSSENFPSVSVRIRTLQTGRYIVRSFYGAVHAITSYSMPENRPLPEYISIVTLLGLLLRRLFRYVKYQNPGFGVVSSSIGLVVGVAGSGERSIARIGFSLCGSKAARNSLIRDRETNLPELSSISRKAYWESGNCAESETFSHLRAINLELIRSAVDDIGKIFVSLTLGLRREGADGDVSLRGKQMCSLCHGLGRCLSDELSCPIMDICPSG